MLLSNVILKLIHIRGDEVANITLNRDIRVGGGVAVFYMRF